MRLSAPCLLPPLPAGRGLLRWRLWALAGLLLWCCVWGLARADHLMVRAEQWTDPAGQATPDQVLARQSGWTPFDGSLRVPGAPGTVWLRFQPMAGLGGPLYFEAYHPNLDHLELFEPVGAGWRLQSSGDRVAHRSWPVNDRHPVVSLAQPNPERTYLLRLRNATAVQLAAQWQNQQELDSARMAAFFLLGACAGLGLLAFVLAVAFSLSYRDLAMGVYAGYVLATMLMLATNQGLAAQYLWPDAPDWSNDARFVVTWVAVVLGLWTCVEVAGLQELAPRLWRLLAVLALGQLVLAGLCPGWPAPLALKWLNLAAALSMLVSMAVLVFAHQRGNRQAMATALAFAPLLAGALLPILRNLGALPMDAGTTRHAFAATLSVHLPALLWILSRRSRQRSESRVRSKALSNTDRLTGLPTTRVARIRLEQTIARAKKLDQAAALLLIDLHNLDQIHSRFGRDVAEAALAEAARRLRPLVREVDTLARLRGGRFALIAEGPLDREEISALATQVIARGLSLPTPVPEQTALKFQVAIAALQPGTTPTRLVMERAATLLEQTGGQDDGRAIRWLDT